MSHLSWWIVARTPDGVSAWEIGDPDADTRAGLVMRARVLAGFPHGDDWASTPERSYDLALTEEPHPNVGAAVRPVSELQSCDSGLLGSYTAEHARVCQSSQVAAAEQTLASLTDAQVDELIARRQQTAATLTTRGGR